MTLDPGADISDVYAFVSYDAANVARPVGQRTVTLIMNVVPGQEPSSGPNYFGFDDDVLYALNVDNDRDGVANDVRYELRFETTIETPGQILATLGVPPVTALEGAGAAGIAVKQRFRVVERRDCGTENRFFKCRTTTPLFDGALRPTVPSNIGPATMPNYEALAAQGIATDAATGIRVFAGQRAETFAIDLGAVFDTLNLRVENGPPIPMVRPPLPVQTPTTPRTRSASMPSVASTSIRSRSRSRWRGSRPTGSRPPPRPARSASTPARSASGSPCAAAIPT
jgi:hypothetical protein